MRLNPRMSGREVEVVEVTVAEVMAELAALEDPRVREINQSTGTTTE